MDILLDKAREYAKHYHKNQYYGYLHYICHLDQVYETLIEHKYIEEKYQVAAYLHDILEDTDCKYSLLKMEFGEEIAEIVYAVTDEMGRNRKERKEKTYLKIKQNKDAIIVKLADRLANVKYSIETKNISKFVMYQKEYKNFKKALKIENNSLWDYLEREIKLGLSDRYNIAYLVVKEWKKEISSEIRLNIANFEYWLKKKYEKNNSKKI